MHSSHYLLFGILPKCLIRTTIILSFFMKKLLNEYVLAGGLHKLDESLKSFLFFRIAMVLS